MTKNIQLSFSGLSASVARDGFSETGYILEIGGAEQSHVDLTHPDHIFYEYLRRIGHLADLVTPAGQPITAAHLGAGALTLVRYLQATRPGSRQIAVDIERELPSFVISQLPLPAGTDCQILIEDAAAAVPELGERLGAPQGLELMVLDIFSGWSAPEHLTTPGFYTDLRDALAQEGMLVVNVGDDAGLSFFAAQACTMLETFEHVWCLTESSMLTTKHAGNLILAGSSRDLDADTRARLLAAGPHPASVLDTHELAEFIGAL